MKRSKQSHKASRKASHLEAKTADATPSELPNTQMEARSTFASLDGWAEDDHVAGFATFLHELQGDPAISAPRVTRRRAPADLRTRSTTSAAKLTRSAD